MKQVAFLFLALLSMLLSSCIEGDEEIFLNADGSARLKAVYSLPALIFSDEDALQMQAQIAKEIGEEEKVNLLTNTIERVKGKQVITIEVETADLLQLEDLIDDGDGDDTGSGDDEGSKSEQVLNALLGKFAFQREGLNADINRKVDLAPLLEKYLGERGPAMLGESEFRYTIHFPKAVNSSNAHEVSNGGRTVKWVYRLSECKDKPIELDIQAPIPVPWWVYALVGGLFLLLLLIICVFVKRLKA